jgi:uncharacterized protein (DUF1697 family)
MPRYIALLRAVNLAGSSMVRMEELRGLLEQLGYHEVQSILQSGNLVFEGPARTETAMEHQLEAAVANDLKLRTEIFVRSGPEWAKVIAGNPFPEEAERDPAHLVLMTLRDPPPGASWDKLRAAMDGPERIEPAGRYAYVTYPEGIGRSRVTNRLLESKLGTLSTGRNWNTVLKLDALANAP